MMWRRLCTPAGGLCVLLSGGAVAGCGGGPDAGAGAARDETIVHAVVVRPAPLPIVVASTGVVTPRPGALAVLSAPAPGRVAAIHVGVGDPVAPGAALVSLDRAPFEAGYRQALAAQQAARQALDRATRLGRAGIAPRKEVEQAQSALAQSEGALVVARRALEFSVLRAPLAGVVTRIAATLDAQVDANQPLVEVVDPSRLEIRLALNPRDAARVRPGMPLTFNAADGSPDTLGTGTIVAVSAMIDSVARSVEVRARVTQSARAVRIGETVSARMTLGLIQNALIVPEGALVPEGSGFRVFVVGGDGIARARAVTVGIRAGAGAQITSGVRAGERVVTDGAYALNDSTRVRVRDAVVPRTPRP